MAVPKWKTRWANRVKQKQKLNATVPQSPPIGQQSLFLPKVPVKAPEVYAPPVQDEQYKLGVSGLNQTNTNTNAGIKAGETQTGLDYGVTFGRTGTDAVDPNTIAFDYSNPFSRASELKRNFENANAMSSLSFANRGQLTSGSYGRAQQSDAINYEGNKDSLMKDFTNRYLDYQNQRTSANDAQTLGVLNEKRSLLERQPAPDATATTPTVAPTPPTNLPKIPKTGATAMLRRQVSGALTASQLKLYGFRTPPGSPGTRYVIKNGVLVRIIPPGSK